MQNCKNIWMLYWWRRISVCLYKIVWSLLFSFQTDTHGIARSKTVPKKHYEKFAKSGLNMILAQLAFDPQAGIAMNTGYVRFFSFLMWFEWCMCAVI